MLSRNIPPRVGGNQHKGVFVVEGTVAPAPVDGILVGLLWNRFGRPCSLSNAERAAIGADEASASWALRVESGRGVGAMSHRRSTGGVRQSNDGPGGKRKKK